MEKNWWKKAVVYQIYPRSFYDTNSDGVGDIPGIIQKLDYLKYLGINTVWLSPVYKSPMDDNGYDISDYYSIDPLFGTNADIEELLDKAKKLNIKIVMDMVINHTSDEHKWFIKAKADPEGPYAKYYYIQKGKDGNPPNNWRSIFGGSAWEPIEGTPYYYLHLFQKKQPDLNWENISVRTEIYKMMNWWLDKGIAGFRMDAICYIKKEKGLPSYAPDGKDGLVSASFGSLSRPGLTDILYEIRDKTYGRVNAMTVGETAGIADKDLLKFISLENGTFSMIFDFSWAELNLKQPNCFWYDTRKWNVKELKEKLFHRQKITKDKGWLGLCLTNHDQPCVADHYLEESGRNFYGQSMLAIMYLFLRGTPFVYQGQELGMRNVNYPSLLYYNDCSTYNQYNVALKAGYSLKESLKIVQVQSRDNSRSPFQWNAEANAGFTTGNPWIPVNKNYEKINVLKEKNDTTSLLNFYRKLINLRLKSEYADIFSEGTIDSLFIEEENIVAYTRSYNQKTVMIICNYQNKPVDLTLSDIAKKIIIDNYTETHSTQKKIHLQSYEGLILELS